MNLYIILMLELTNMCHSDPSKFYELALLNVVAGLELIN